VHLADKKLVQLADVTMQDLTPSENGLYALGADDRHIARSLNTTHVTPDTYIVDTHTGLRTLAAKKHQEGLTSPRADAMLCISTVKDWLGVPFQTGRPRTSPPDSA